MKVTRHGDHLIQLTRFGLINCYLVAEDDGFTLVDTGLGGSAAGILEAAGAAGRPIRRLTVTHAHGDHAGSLDALAALLPGAEIALNERTARFLQGDRALSPTEPQARLRGSFVTARTSPTRILQPGDRLGSLRVFAAPGHTPDQVAFLDERDGSLLAGDAFQTQGGLAVAGDWRWRFPLPALATWHRPTALASAQALADLAPRLLAVGHGPMLPSPGPALATALETAAAAV